MPRTSADGGWKAAVNPFLGLRKALRRSPGDAQGRLTITLENHSIRTEHVLSQMLPPMLISLFAWASVSRCSTADATTFSPIHSGGRCRKSSWPSGCGTRRSRRSACPHAASTTSATRSSRSHSRQAKTPDGVAQVCGTSEQMIFDHYRTWMPKLRRGHGRQLIGMLGLGPKLRPKMGPSSAGRRQSAGEINQFGEIDQ